MAENKELKPKSFRISEETAEKFKEISLQLGENQQETLAKLIEAYEFQASKINLTSKKADIEQFEKYISCLTSLYMQSLEDNQNVTETVRTQFEALLRSKDTTIQDLQEKIRVADEKLKEEKEVSKIIKDKNDELSTKLQQINDEYEKHQETTKELLQSKQEQNEALVEATKSLKKRIETLEAYETQIEELNVLKNEITQLKAELQKKEFEHEKQMMNLEKKYNQKIVDLREKHLKQIEDYQSKYKELLQAQAEPTDTEEK